MVPALLFMLGTIVMVPESPGGQLYITHCATCHGSQMSGSSVAPSLQNVGVAAVDFWMRTGRMPAAVPGIEVGHRDQRNGQALPAEQIEAIETYLAPIAGSPAIPDVVANGDVQRGQMLFAQNCEHCHGARGDGGAIGGSDWAPDLHHAAITQVAEAIRIGPGQMPRFGVQQISQDDLDDIVTYVSGFSTRDPRGFPLASSGPVPEGAMSWLAILVLLLFVFTYWRSDTPPADRRDTQRRDS